MPSDSLFGEIDFSEFSIGQYEGEVFVTHLMCGQYYSESTNSLEDAVNMAKRLSINCPIVR